MPYKDPEKERERGRQRRLTPEYQEYRRRYIKARYENDPEYREEVKARTRQAGSRIVWRAHKAVARAIKRGDLVRPDACEQCRMTGFVEAAHSDYTQPLFVRWLCRRCHRLDDFHEPKSH